MYVHQFAYLQSANVLVNVALTEKVDGKELDERRLCSLCRMS